MAYLQDLLTTQQQTIAQQQSTNDQLGLGNRAYAQYFPTWEVTAPQYPIPQPWSLSLLGYKTNEVAYACISLKMKSISEPPLRIWDKQEEEFIDDGDNEEFYRFMEQPCPNISETDFHTANQMYLDIAGFMGWEKDMANNGSLIALWPIMPQYCSFMRGQGKLLRAIHYLPYTGLPAYDIPRERIVLMMYFDPQYFGLKPLSPTAVLSDVIGVDNNMTKMIDQFMRNAGFLSGLLKTEQVLNDKDAEFAKQRWAEVHGGPANAGQIAVLGKGLEFQSSGNTFRDMVFPEVDARSETRICMGYSVPPILVSAKSGMDRATYSNYEQARKAWYEEYVTSQWKFLEERYTKDILPHFDADTNHILKFDTKEVKALQEDRNAAWKRSDDAYKSRIITRNDALREKGLTPLENELLGNEYYQTAMTQQSLSLEDNLDIANATQDVAQAKEELDVRGQELVKVTTKDDEDDEEKKFRAFAKRRLKENKPNDIGEYEFKHLSDKRQRILKSEFGVPDPNAILVLEGLKEVIKALQPKPERSNDEMIININNPANVDMTSKETIKAMEQMTNKISSLGSAIKATPAPLAPVVNITNKVEPTPIENRIEVNPTPIENKVDVNLPRIKRERQKVKRDGGNNIEGTITEVEYED